MGREEFKAVFVLTKEPTPAMYDVKTLLESLGMKVVLPMSYGDPILIEYEEKQAPLPVPEPIPAPVIETNKTEEKEPEPKPKKKKKIKRK